MFSFVLRRGAFISHKLSQRCWSSSSSPFSPFPPLGTTPLLFSDRRPTGHRPIHSSAARFKKRPRPEPPPRELDLLRYDMKELPRTPRPALCLGLAGLLPFAGPTLFMAAAEAYVPELAYAQLAYGASILSFLGGIRWGFALPPGSPAQPDWMNLANAVVPPLLAWAAMLMSRDLAPAVTMVIMGLGVALHYDLALLPTYPRWFKALRAVLTVVACLSLLGTMTVYWGFPEKRMFPAEKEKGDLN